MTMIPLIDENLEAYALDHTTEEPELLRQLAMETIEKMKSSQMLTGRVAGTFLKLLVSMIGARRVLEVGMFTGYGALMMASALPEDGKLITCEVDREAEAMARSYFARSPYGHKIEIRMGPALETIEELEGPFDFIFIDADKENYPAYYELCLGRLRSKGVIAVDNALWSGRVLEPTEDGARAIAAMNDRVHRDERVEHVLLAVRDGILLVVKK
jgi:caffeoyl-CoA O-methyltransferase